MNQTSLWWISFYQNILFHNFRQAQFKNQINKISPFFRVLQNFCSTVKKLNWKRQGKESTVQQMTPKNLTPVVQVLEVFNADRCLGYRPQLYLRRKLTILKSFIFNGSWHQAQSVSNFTAQVQPPLQQAWFQSTTLFDRQGLQGLRQQEMMVTGWKRDYMDDNLLDCYVQLPNRRDDAICFLHWTGCFLQQ